MSLLAGTRAQHTRVTVTIFVGIFCNFGSSDFRNTAAPTVNHRIYGDGSFQIVERVRDSVQSGGSRCRRLGSSTDWLNTVKGPGKKSPYATYSAGLDICQEFAL